MHDLLPPLPLFGAFLAASFVLAVTPGPGVFYIVARSIAQGRASGLASVAGVALGNLGNAVGASLGLAAVFAVSGTAFVVVKYAGALYLIWLGVQALRAPSATEADAAPPPPAALKRIFADGFVVALLNPKTALFFAAFLPQFLGGAADASTLGLPRVTADGSTQDLTPVLPVLRPLVLGGIFVAMATVTDTCYALAAGAVRPWLLQARGLRAFGRWLTGGAFIGLGVLAALSGQRPRV